MDMAYMLPPLPDSAPRELRLERFIQCTMLHPRAYFSIFQVRVVPLDILGP